MKSLIGKIQIRFQQRFDMKKLKVMTVVGTRPEIIRLSRVLSKMDEYFEHILVHTGQNYDYELNQIFFDDLGLRKPDYFLEAAGSNGAQTIGNVIIAVDGVLDTVNPDALLVLGDTNSCMAVLPAKRRKIPTFHMEAGNRCFDMRVPEEINRRIVDHTADINLTYSTIAREYLLREGLPPDMIIKTGSPMFEVLHHYLNEIQASNILERLNLEINQFFLVSLHREENIDSENSFKNAIDVLNALGYQYDLPIIVSTHPRTQKRIDSIGAQFHSRVQLLKPLGFMDYNKLQISAKVVLSDSGTINEESSILNFPALNLRQAHERPEGMEETTVMMVGLSSERVLQALAILEHQLSGQSRTLQLVQDYSMPNVSEKVARVILSYTDYVNRVVWKKNNFSV
jgi:UDP-N-acetylglucosamine 2-epimerase (non-hydrolysing)